MKFSFHRLIPLLPLFCNCQFRRLDSIQFLSSQAHIPAGWRLETRLFTLLATLLVKVKVTLLLTVSQLVSLGVEPHLGLMTRYLLLFDSYGLFVGPPLWRENGPVFCICCWPLPVQSFSGPSPLELATIFYCLRFETSLFVASYDSQGHGGGISTRALLFYTAEHFL
jgi:hypothetical protein